MGFDNECIQNIQSLAGEYFCPVCRLLVYPDEALYTQCTHLYCKPCLAYVASTTRACPYDGYQVTEADTKPLTEANKTLAETIGRIAVNCLYHRSGCTWQGTLSETGAHCAGCAYGNSPVVCNRCGTQIVHRQVQEHAQICPGEQPLALQAATSTAAADQNQAVVSQAGAPASQSQASETATVATAAGQVQSQSTPTAQPQAAVSQVAQTPEQQWYQQQQQYYQQYYQQYPGYDPYQQQYQQYVQYQQQLQAHPQQMVQGQPQSYSQPQPQAQAQLQVQPQAPVQGPAQPQPQPQPLSQPQVQSHLHIQPQMAGQPQMQPQAPQQQQHVPLQSHPQVLPQGHAVAPVVHAGQPLPQPLLQAQPQMQPHQQHPQMQLHPQAQHSQPHPQAQPRPLQPQAHPNPYAQPHIQHHPQLQPQPLSQLNLQAQAHLQPQPHPQHPAGQAVSGHQTYPQPQQYQQMPPGAPHMHPQQQGAPHPMGQHTVPMQGQFPQQQPQMRAPHHSQVPQQHPQQTGMMPAQGQHLHAPQLQQQPVHHPGQQLHQQPGMPLSQQQHIPQQAHYPQQQTQVHPHQPQHFPGQAPGLVHSHQLVQPQQSVRPQVHPHPGLPPHHSQSPGGRPTMPQQVAMHQSHPGGSAAAGHGVPGPGQLQQSLPPRPDNQSAQLSASVPSGAMALVSSANATLKPTSTENKHGDPTSEKAAEATALGSDGVEGRESSSADFKTPKAETGLKSSECEEKSLGGSDYKSARHDHAVNEVSDSSLKHEKDLESSVTDRDSVDPVIRQMVKEDTSEKSEPKDAMNNDKVDESSRHAATDAKIILMQSAENIEVQDAKLQKDAVDSKIASMQNVISHGQSSLNDGRTIPASQHPLSANDRAGPNPGYFPHQGAVPDDHQGLLPPGQMPAKTFGLQSHSAPVPDHRQMHMPYGPSQMQDGIPQRPPVTDRMIPPSMHHPGPNLDRRFQEPVPPQMQMQAPPIADMRPQGHAVPESFPHHQQGQPPAGQEHLAQRTHGPFPSDALQGGFLVQGMPASVGRGPSILGPAQSFESQPVGPHGQSQGLLPSPYAVGQRTPLGDPLSGVPPGAFGSAGGMMLRGPLGPEGQMSRLRPINPTEAEMLVSKRPGFFDGRQIDPHLPIGAENATFGQPSGLQSSNAKVNGIPGKGVVAGDSASLHGLPEERFRPLPEERFKSGAEEAFKPHVEDRFKPFVLDSGRRVIDRMDFEEDLKQFPRPSHMDGENASKFESGFSSLRPLDQGPHVFGDRAPHALSHDIGLRSDLGAGSSFPVGSVGSSVHSMDAGDRLRSISFHDNLGRGTDPSGAPPDFLRHPSGFGRYRGDNLPPTRSPGREPSGIHSSRFGSMPAAFGLGSQSRIDDFDGRDPRSFGDRWLGSLPPHLRCSEHDGPGNLRVNEQVGSGKPLHLMGGDFGGSDILGIHLREPFVPGMLSNMRGGEPRNFPGHMRLGDPHRPGHLMMGEMGGPGHLPPNLRIGESVGGGTFPSHMRIGEPGFGGGLPAQGFQGSLQGDLESFDHGRKRKPGSMGWCRICKIDCETVEGLEVHSQTREHQKVAMDMVLSIKQDNAKRHKLSLEENIMREDANKPRKASFESKASRN